MIPTKPPSSTLRIPAIRARFKHADCYQSACLNLALMAGPKMYSPPGPNGAKKKKKKHTAMFGLYVRTEFCFFFFFFFFFLALIGPVGVQICPCHKGQVQTCQLVAIGTFDPGPDGANVDSGPVAFEMYKKKKKKKKKKKNHTAMFGLYVRTEFCIFFFFFFFFYFFFFLALIGPVGVQILSLP